MTAPTRRDWLDAALAGLGLVVFVLSAWGIAVGVS